MVGSQLPSHMCVQTQYDARSIRRAACQTDRPSGVRRERDGRAVYSVHVYRRFLDALLSLPLVTERTWERRSP